MFNNIALDVVIGLVFVFLLYSLFATILVEIIATKLGLRARNLKEAVDRMLNDEEEIPSGTWKSFKERFGRILDSLNLLKNPDNDIINRFYNDPEIKYLGSSGVFRNPSSFKAVSFSKTLLYLLSKEKASDKETIEEELRYASGEASRPAQDNPQPQLPVMGPETAKYVLSLWRDSNRDIAKFKIQLEAWFDRTMEQTTEWYKRKIQIILLVLGFMLAWWFNADTFSIIRKLSTDKTAREQMVQMATAYIQNNNNNVRDPRIIVPAPSDSATAEEIKKYKAGLDSLLLVKKQLEADIQKANSLLGSGSWLDDIIRTDIHGVPLDSQRIETAIFPKVGTLDKDDKGNFVSLELHHKFCYLFRMLTRHFWGFLVTAIAISLGAPFWFDLLNKLMKLRTSIKQPIDSTGTNRNTASVSLLNREG